MPRPPAELRKLEEEQRRRVHAHRRLRWGRRVRLASWALGGLLLLVILLLAARLVGVGLP